VTLGRLSPPGVPFADLAVLAGAGAGQTAAYEL
jgi:hypothetical protein